MIEIADPDAIGRAEADRLRHVLARERRRVMLRLAGLLGAAVATALLAETGHVMAAVATAVVALGLARAFIRRTERPARDLLRFLDGLRNDDPMMRFKPGQGPLLDALHAAFSEVTEAFRRVRSEREEQALYLQTIVRHVGVALLAVRDDGTIALFNEAAARLLGVSRPGTHAALAARQPTLAAALADVRTGGRTLVEVERNEEPLTLVVHTTRFQLGGGRYTLASLQDISPELEQREIEAWQQLTRVLTHEITNSVAPIASLAATVRDLLEGADVPADVREALRVIERRCEGLVSFVEAYRSLTRLPAPVFRIVPAREVLGGVVTLLRRAARERGVTLTCSVVPDGLDLVADPDLLEQALVNVVLNALQAAERHEGGHVIVRGRVGVTGRPVVEVEDDGPGILPEVQERVFVPFFTTRPDGSGIGLSLARQIQRLHGGSLTVRSTPGQGATFTFRF